MESGYFLGCRLSDVSNPHGIEPEVEGFALCLIERLQHLCGAFFAKESRLKLGAEVEFAEGDEVEVEEVERSLDVSIVDYCFSHRAAESVNIESLSRGKLLDACDSLGWAGEVSAAPCDHAFFLGNR